MIRLSPIKGLQRTRRLPAKEVLELTEEKIIWLLRERHKDRQWVFFPEMVFSTKAKDDMEQADSRIDAWAFNIWPSRGFEMISYEVKITRHDFLREMRKPEKREPGLRISNKFYYVLPHGCVNLKEIPEECGLITIRQPKDKDYFVLYTAKVAPHREIEPLELDFWAGFSRRINRAEGEYIDEYDRKLAQMEAKKAKQRGHDKKSKN